MRLWDNLRTAYQLAERVEEVEKAQLELAFEWGEIQEKLLTREERLRKRLSRELKASLAEVPVPDPVVAPAATQGAKMAIVRSFRESKGQ